MPFPEIWIDLETVIQSEVSHKKKNKYCTLMFYLESRKLVQMTLFAKRNRNKDIENKCMDSNGEMGGGGMNWEIGVDIIVYIRQSHIIYGLPMQH